MSNQILTNNIGQLSANVIASASRVVSPGWGEKVADTDVNKLYLIKQGEGSIIINGITYYPKAGDLILIPKDSLSGYTTSLTAPYDKYWCHFDATVDSIPLHSYLNFPYLQTPYNFHEVENTFKELLAYEHSTQPFHSIAANAALLKLLFLFFNNIHNQVSYKSISNNTFNKKIIQYIDDNLHRKVSVTELANFVHLHPNYFSSFFATSFGMPPLEYVNSRKILKAKLLLSNHSLTIEDISLELGFSTPYYFSAVFKKRTGLSPSKFRYLYFNANNSQKNKTNSI